MNARERILEAVRRARPPATPLPAADHAPWRRSGDSAEPGGEGVAEAAAPASVGLAARFAASARAVGTDVVEADRGSREAALREAVGPEADARIASQAPGIAATVPFTGTRRELAQLDVFVCEAVLGVAENGAVWITPASAGARAALFLAPHVVVVLDRAAVVADLHDACARLDLGAAAFGMFMAGPSKTADIEQALVVGAHGPGRVTVILIGPEAGAPA